MPAHRRRFACILAVVAAVLLVYAPGSALGQGVSLADTPMEVQLWPGGEPGYTLYIVTAHIPQVTPLPAVVHLPLPENSEVLWAGEILGGPVDEDPQRETSIVEVSTGFALEMTAEATRTVQYEAVGPPLTVIDGMTTTVFDWVQTVPVGEVSFSVRMPATAEEIRIEPEAPGPPRTNERGEQLYTLRPVTLAEGQEFTITASWGTSVGGSREGRATPLLGLLLAALGVALVALMIALFFQRRQAP